MVVILRGPVNVGTKESGNVDETNYNDIWQKAIQMFQTKQLDSSKHLYEVYMKEVPDNLEAKGQYVSYGDVANLSRVVEI